VKTVLVLCLSFCFIFKVENCEKKIFFRPVCIESGTDAHVKCFGDSMIRGAASVLQDWTLFPVQIAWRQYMTQ